MSAVVIADVQLQGQLATLREVTASIKRMEAEHQAEQARIDRDRVALLEPLRKVQAQLLADIGAWLNARRDQLRVGARSVRLPHGTLGLRATAAKVVFRHGQEHAERVLRARGHREVFRTTETLDVGELKKLSAAELRQAGVELCTGEVAYISLPDGTSFPVPEPAPAPETP